jgi:hypothetical protein
MLTACRDVVCELYPHDESIAGKAGLMIQDRARSITEKYPLEDTELMQTDHSVTEAGVWHCSPDFGLY